PAYGVEPRKQLALDVEVLEDRLDDEVGLRQRAEIRGIDQIAERGVALAFRHLAALDGLAEEALGALARGGEAGALRVVAQRAEARARGDQRDAGSHGAACAADGHGLYRCRHWVLKLRPMSWRWTWLVPSQIWVILASRIRRSAR